MASKGSVTQTQINKLLNYFNITEDWAIVTNSFVSTNYLDEITRSPKHRISGQYSTLLHRRFGTASTQKTGYKFLILWPPFDYYDILPTLAYSNYYSNSGNHNSPDLEAPNFTNYSSNTRKLSAVILPTKYSDASVRAFFDKVIAGSNTLFLQKSPPLTQPIYINDHNNKHPIYEPEAKNKR